ALDKRTLGYCVLQGSADTNAVETGFRAKGRQACGNSLSAGNTEIGLIEILAAERRRHIDHAAQTRIDRRHIARTDFTLIAVEFVHQVIAQLAAHEERPRMPCREHTAQNGPVELADAGDIAFVFAAA